MSRPAPFAALAVLLALAPAACQGPPAARIDGSAPPPDGGAGAARLTPLFVTPPLPACEMSGPLAITSQGAPEILLVTADGVFTAVDPLTGAAVWRVALAAGDGLLANLAAPPAVVGHRLVFAWQEVMPDWTRVAHHVGVLDLDARALDPQFPALTLAASLPAHDGAGPIVFRPDHAFSRAAVVHADVPDRTLGLAYVSFGNVRDLQPWHGWLFEIDLDVWQADGGPGAVTGTLVTTGATSDCGNDDDDGAREMVCGGGVWAARGPEVIPDPASPDGFALLVATGNGLLDPTRGSYANAVLRVGRGLAFAPGCDATLCDGFDPSAPTDACAASCDHLFIPRLPAGQEVPRGANDACVGLTLFQCYAALDWDLGAERARLRRAPRRARGDRAARQGRRRLPDRRRSPGDALRSRADHAGLWRGGRHLRRDLGGDDRDQAGRSPPSTARPGAGPDLRRRRHASRGSAGAGDRHRRDRRPGGSRAGRRRWPAIPPR